jgi:photosystem II stability/assembly factor-like uncharacterized protein
VRKGPYKGFGEWFSSSGLGKRRSWWKWTCRVAISVRVVSERESSLFLVVGKKGNFHHAVEKGKTSTKSRNGKADM